MQKRYSDAERLELMRTDRRALHQIPEYGYDLFETRAYVEARLREVQPDELTPMADGFRVVFHAEKPVKPAIAFRADMDALHIEEKNSHDFVSKHPGCMHACGHDGHMANLLMFARVIAGRRAELDRDVVLVFQPAEESYGGARPMIDAGLFRDPDVKEIYGMHLAPYVPFGRVAFIPGPEMAMVESGSIHIQGKGSHGAMPHMGNDAVMAMAQFCTTVQAALRRRIDANQPVVFTIGHVTAGSAPNIVAESADLEWTLRCYDERVGQQIRALMQAALDAADAMYGTVSTIAVDTVYPPVINDPELTERLKRLAGDRYMSIEPQTIAEDFSEYQKEIPGVFLFMGCGDEAHHEPLHSDTFDFDERALLHSVALFEQILFGSEA
ncbi:MAG: M20 family metallopeptidase [Clostridia bacterium]|nr:M20 family metallopeptidase [Clostridia bacterium]